MGDRVEPVLVPVKWRGMIDMLKGCLCDRGERRSQKTSLGANKGLMTNWLSHSGVAPPRIRGSTGDRQRSLGNDV